MKILNVFWLVSLVAVMPTAWADLELLRCTAQGGGRVARATVAFDLDRALVGDLLLELESRGSNVSLELQGAKATLQADGGVLIKSGNPARQDHLAVRLNAPKAATPALSFWYTTVFNYNATGSNPGVTICSRTSIQNNRPARRAECLEDPNVCAQLSTP